MIEKLMMMKVMKVTLETMIEVMMVAMMIMMKVMVVLQGRSTSHRLLCSCRQRQHTGQLFLQVFSIIIITIILFIIVDNAFIILTTIINITMVIISGIFAENGARPNLVANILCGGDAGGQVHEEEEDYDYHVGVGDNHDGDGGGGEDAK